MTTIAAFVLVLLFRMACLSGSRAPLKLQLQLLSGLWLGVAAWVAGAMLQAWVPIWQMLLSGVALAAGIAALRFKFRINAQPAADFIAIAAMAPLSVIPVRIELVIAAAIAFAAAGFVLDAVTGRLRPQLKWALLAMPPVLLVLLGLQVRQPGNFGSRLLAQDEAFPLRLVLVVPSPGARVPLEPGTAGWLLRHPDDNPCGTAIVMHGNHHLRSQQPSAVALQGALMRAGYDVLSVDHPGFGASPTPDASAEWNDWDPALGPAKALSYLSRENKSRAPATIVVGHSMGVDVALKFVADGAAVQHAYLFGGSLDRPYGPNWPRGFHRERNIPCCIPSPIMSMIRDEFYGGADRFAAALPRDHAAQEGLRLRERVALLQYALHAALRSHRLRDDPAHCRHLRLRRTRR